jgi:hypothetical protein
MFKPTLLLALACGCAPLLAQSTTGTILGTVKDSSGALIPPASIVVTNTGTNARY